MTTLSQNRLVTHVLFALLVLATVVSVGSKGIATPTALPAQTMLHAGLPPYVGTTAKLPDDASAVELVELYGAIIDNGGECRSIIEVARRPDESSVVQCDGGLHTFVVADDQGVLTAQSQPTKKI